MNLTSLISRPMLTMQPTPKYLVGDWMPEASMGLMTADSNVGKTALAMKLAECLHTGNDFMGHKIHRTMATLVVQFDMDKATFTSYNNKYAPAVPLVMMERESQAVMEDGTVEHTSFDFTSRTDVSQLIGMCKEAGIEFIILDTLSTTLRGVDENSNTDMTEALSILKTISYAGISVLLTHHCAKVLDSRSHVVRGASAIVAMVDYHLTLTPTRVRVDDGRVVSTHLAKTRVTFQKHLFSFYINGVGINIAPTTPTDCSRIVDAYESLNTTILSRKAIQEQTGMHPAKLQSELERLVKDGTLGKSKDGRQDMYSLVKDGAE